MALLVPAVATSQAKPKITTLIREFNRVELYGIKSAIEEEWDNLANKTWLNTKDAIGFWAEVFEDKDAGGNKRFENIARFALSLLTTPISNATVERAFSIYAVIKDKLRNKLSISTMQSLMMVRYSLKRDHKDCVNFQPTAQMLKNFTTSMYDFKNQDKSAEQNKQSTFDAVIEELQEI